jgi:protein-S-isoprenylcysteine O-methyltransferase Ste14
MNADSAHQSNWAIAEVVFGVPFLIGIGLQFIFPFSFSSGIVHKILIAVGVILIITSIWFIVLSRGEFSQYDQPTDPNHPTSMVIKTGVFSISRNPLYLGSVILFFGIALMLNTLWTFVALLASIIACHYLLIIPEEKYLAAKFGGEYKAYTATVHRWFGRKRPGR